MSQSGRNLVTTLVNNAEVWPHVRLIKMTRPVELGIKRPVHVITDRGPSDAEASRESLWVTVDLGRKLL